MSPRPGRPSPAQLCVSWPYVASDDPVAEAARLFARNVVEAMGGRSYREISRLSGVHHEVLSSVAAGESWPDLVTIVRLEEALGEPLFPAKRG
ncbi:helix-turn-helix domain-containing protein [Mycetocola manganoxydans]|uniref:helix-turn-helix domain-containing protein n=1 Tax=Mycetocola manganoxydans TaxID=699879 RepID=UPI0011C47F04|nr:helix-turn-helix transcriptional regulator [Mycetocola manganoxydans]